MPDSHVRLLMLYFVLRIVRVGPSGPMATELIMWSCSRIVLPRRRRQYVRNHLHGGIIIPSIGRMFLQNSGDYIPDYTA